MTTYDSKYLSGPTAEIARWAQTKITDFAKDPLGSVAGLYNDTENWLWQDHSSLQLVMTWIDKAKPDAKATSIKFSVQPQNAISFQHTNNIAVFNQSGAFPVIQNVSPAKTVVGWQGLFYDSKRSKTYTEEKGNRYQFDVCQKLVRMQENGLPVVVKYGPIVFTALIETFQYAVKRFDLIQYSIQLIVDSNATKALRDKSKASQEYWMNGERDATDLLGTDNPIANTYNAYVNAKNSLVEGASSFTEKFSNATDNFGILTNRYSNLLIAPVNEVRDTYDYAKAAVDQATGIRDNIRTSPAYEAFFDKLR